jgi:hypothetical protein
MTESKLKQVVEQIKKLADDELGDVWGNQPKPPAPKTPGGGGGGYVAPRNQAVMAMQSAMQDLANSVMRDLQSATMFRKPTDAHQGQGTDQQNTGRSAFANLLAEQYAGELPEDKRGVEWSTAPGTQSYQQKQQSQTGLYEMNVVMDTLQRIGSPKPGNEYKADGVWQFRTDNALKNMAGFANALLSFESDFPLQNDAFTKADLDRFYQLLSGYEVKPPNGVVSLKEAEKTQRAIEITKLLKKINSLYNSFRRQFLARPALRSLIEGQRAFDKYSPTDSNKDVFNPTEQQIANNPSQTVGASYTGFEGGKPKNFNQLPLSALSSRDEFIKFLKSVGYTDSPGPTNVNTQAANVLNQIIKSVQQSMELPTTRK